MRQLLCRPLIVKHRNGSRCSESQKFNAEHDQKLPRKEISLHLPNPTTNRCFGQIHNLGNVTNRFFLDEHLKNSSIFPEDVSLIFGASADGIYRAAAATHTRIVAFPIAYGVDVEIEYLGHGFVTVAKGKKLTSLDADFFRKALAHIEPPVCKAFNLA